MTELAIDTTATNVRKWGRIKFGISDYGAVGITIPGDPDADPDDWFDKLTYKPKPFPAGVKDLGFIRTSGVVDAKSISANDEKMLQSLIPVRSDLEGITKTMQAVFGESNAYTNALYHLLPVAAWPASKDAAWAYSDTTDIESPDYVLWLQGVDGVGTQAIYRYEIGYRVKVTAIDNRTLNRSESEGFGFTFGFYPDPVAGMVHSRVEEGPGRTTHLTYAP